MFPAKALCEIQPLTVSQRGGGGNVYKEKYGGHTHDPNRESIIDKAKHKVEELLHKKPSSRTSSPAPPTKPAA
jgi:hypothetical protein